MWIWCRAGAVESITPLRKSRNNPVITDKLARTLHIRSEAYFERDFTQKARKDSLAFPKTRKYRRAMRSISMMEKTAIPEPVTGDRVLIMLQKAIQFCRQI